MANKKWDGTDIGNEGDWGTGANWIPAGVPGVSDDVQMTGAQAVTSGLDQSAVTILSLSFLPTYTAACGSPGTKLQIKIANDIKNESPSGQFVTTTVATKRVRNRSPLGSAGLFLSCGTGGAALPLVSCELGAFTLDAGDITTLLMESNPVAPSAIVSDATVTLETGAGTVATLRKIGGTLVQRGGIITSLTSLNGSATIHDGTLTGVEVWGGTVDCRTVTTVVTAKCFGGTFDTTKDVRARTVSHIEMHGNAVVKIGLPVTVGGDGVEKYGFNDPVFDTMMDIAGSVVDVPFGP